jgi:enhancer of mRNA-decapping protein 3
MICDAKITILSLVTDNQMVNIANKRGYSTPRKAETRKKTPREDCFSEPVDTFIAEEFDFEKNLALFDKQAVFEEIESQGYPKIVRNGSQHQEAKYKSDENVLPSHPVVLDQIVVPGGLRKQFVTDMGLVVPCIGYDTRNKLLEVAQEAGYKLERQIETVGRSASEMVLQLIGGNHRYAGSRTEIIIYLLY